MFLRFPLVALLLFTISTGAYAQCGIDHLDSLDFIEHISEGGTIESFLEQRTPKANYKFKTEDSLIIIPVVFHIIHEYGRENISTEQILDQLRILNEDFQKMNADTFKTDPYFKARAASMNIRFVLAKRDPEGNCTQGITRHYSWLTHEPRYGECKKLVIWDPQKYLNIWVVRYIEGSGGAGTVLGYAKSPRWGGDSLEDGVVVRADMIGSIGETHGRSKGRVLTHEVGHWLGLAHPFKLDPWWAPLGDGCNRFNDYVDDTPPVKEPNYECPGYVNSCDNDIPDEPDNTQNYMDYTTDSCKTMFTFGQVELAYKYLLDTNFRAHIHSPENIIATGVKITPDCGLVADFTTTNRSTVLCEGTPIQFLNTSYNGNPNQFLWHFEGARTVLSFEENPYVIYEKPGTYDAKLVIDDRNGIAQEVKNDYLVVMPKQEARFAPYHEEFHNLASTENYFLEKDTLGWEHYNKARGFGDSGCLRAANSPNALYGKKYSLVLPPVKSMHDSAVLQLSFKMAYRRAVESEADYIRIYGSKDCGRTWGLYLHFSPWSTRASNTGGKLEPEQGWEPKFDNDWVAMHLNLPPLNTNEQLYLRIDFINNLGNSFFIDDILIYEFTASVEELEPDELKVFPVPTNGILQLNSSLQAERLEVWNFSGQLLLSKTTGDLNKIDLISLPASVYYLKVYLAERMFIKRVVKR
ncbi:MAG: T9SS type A sorting domain-containing protein [Bacteroidia bacterium]